jgi:hypothetical protein
VIRKEKKIEKYLEHAPEGAGALEWLHIRILSAITSAVTSKFENVPNSRTLYTSTVNR